MRMKRADKAISMGSSQESLTCAGKRARRSCHTGGDKGVSEASETSGASCVQTGATAYLHRCKTGPARPKGGGGLGQGTATPVQKPQAVRLQCQRICLWCEALELAERDVGL
ncbi:hypothetical protein AAFF_G00178120 [Aldrovandia affinis]|uniref:Uncharacterized protein n=1 Tax=Aldrovandia affinis TaxID=143900 RepID=A0AAD7W6G4_9TELE|nr:hypothetical protein AAFF_G00178120 [Aldrovandia affinis]